MHNDPNILKALSILHGTEIKVEGDDIFERCDRGWSKLDDLDKMLLIPMIEKGLYGGDKTPEQYMASLKPQPTCDLFNTITREHRHSMPRREILEVSAADDANWINTLYINHDHQSILNGVYFHGELETRIGFDLVAVPSKKDILPGEYSVKVAGIKEPCKAFIWETRDDTRCMLKYGIRRRHGLIVLGSDDLGIQCAQRMYEAQPDHI